MYDYDAEYKKCRRRLSIMGMPTSDTIPAGFEVDPEEQIVWKFKNVAEKIEKRCNTIKDVDKVIKEIDMKFKLFLLRRIAILGIGFFLILIITTAIMQLILGGMNTAQAVGENSDSSYNQGEVGQNSVFSTLCTNCGQNETSVLTGVQSSDFSKRVSEMINLYNQLTPTENKNGKITVGQRMDEFDYALLSATIEYKKRFKAELFQDAEIFGNANNLTNRDAYHYPKLEEIDSSNAIKFFKWADTMLGTPYAINDINLRGLSGNLATGKVVTACVPGKDDKSKEDQDKELIQEIIEIEKKFSGEEDVPAGLWNTILSFLNLPYVSDNKILEEKLKGMFKNLGDPNSKYKDLEPYINTEYYDPEFKCPSGTMRKHTYTKFMNYEQYKVYLENVYIPQNFINCDECILKNSSDLNKKVAVNTILTEIFDTAEEFRKYGEMTEIDYSLMLLKMKNTIDVGDLRYFSSPLKTSCTVTSPYGQRGKSFHSGVDTTTIGTDNSLYSIASGTVLAINIYTTENIGFTYSDSLGTCPLYNGQDVNSGIEVIIEHQIEGTKYYAKYVHLDSVIVKKGDLVGKGDKIGNMGNTGCSLGTHLHFELQVSNNGKLESIDPTLLFRQCANSNIEQSAKVSTTNNFVNPEKCKVDKYTLDEIITSKIKATSSNAKNYPEYVKSLAIVIRTKLMNETDWCNKPLKETVNIDVDNNASDFEIYKYVIDTQGMVLNYSGTLIDSVDYATFPCEKINPSLLYSNRSRLLGILGLSDSPDLTAEEILKKLNAYNAGCVDYQPTSGKNIIVQFSTIPKQVREKYRGVDAIDIDPSFITSTARNATNKFSTAAAMYYASIKKNYTEILYRFYAAKTFNPNNPDFNTGSIDISTSPGLIDAKLSAILAE